MSNLSLAVIGAGHLGRIHARLLAENEHAVLHSIADPDEDSRRSLAQQHGVPAVQDWRSVVDDIDGAVIAAPTVHHAEIAIGLIEAGKHVLVEKPLAFSHQDAKSIVTAGDQRNVVVQSGHCERFNPAFQAIREHLIGAPKLIEARRAGPYSFRSTDIGVVFDLMIHDIDLSLALMKDDIERVDAVGGVVIGPHEDWAQATITFASGSVAQLSACRTAIDPARRFAVTCAQCYAEADLGSGAARILTPGPAIEAGFDPNVLSPAQRETWKPRLFDDLLTRRDVRGEGNAILEEQRDFVQAIQHQRLPYAAGDSAAKAVAVAEQILMRIHGDRRKQSLRKAG